MRFSQHLVDIATFVVVALLVYIGGAVLLAMWPMWAMMSFGLDPVLALVVVALVVGAIWAIIYDIRSRSDRAVEHCPKCQSMIEPNYVLCPECYTTLQRNCRECRQPLKTHWAVCPYCGVAAVAAPLDRPSVTSAEQSATGLERQRAGD